MRQRDLVPKDADTKDTGSTEGLSDSIPAEWLEEREEDLTIDPEDLDMACTRQADIYTKWADRYVDADWKSELKDLKLESVESELQLLCRADPDKFGIHSKSVTEATVKAGIKQASEYRNAYRRHLEARKVKLWLQYTLTALDMKKRMLETLTTLHGQEYFAGPSIPHNLSKLWQDNRKKATETKMSTLARKVKVPASVIPKINSNGEGESKDEDNE